MGFFYQRKERMLSDESKQFLHSLPSTCTTLFRKRRPFVPLWSSHPYWTLIKSTFLIYGRAATSETALEPPQKRWSRHQVHYVNLQHCIIQSLDHEEAATRTQGYIVSIVPESGTRAMYFAAETEKDRARFMAQVAAVQQRVPSLNEFTTLKLLGRGHYGRVILASYAADAHLYAIKEMKLGQVKAKVALAERAVMEWAGGHPFIMGLDFALARGRSVFLISKFMQGGDLFLHMQKNGGSFDEDTVRFYATELLLALEHLHTMCIMHRDIKPENVLLDRDGHIKLADMGLAKRLESREGRTKTMCGTDVYLPPEMVGRYAGGHGLPVDLWQFGCILFELYAGYPPFFLPQSSQESTHQRILYDPVCYPNHVSPELKSLLAALLEKRQEDRLGYCGGIADVKAHKFFAGVDWDQVLRRQIKPPLMPGPPGEELVGNFDPQFTQQPHAIYAPEEIACCSERAFTGFDYVRPLDPSGLMVSNTRSQMAASPASCSRTSTIKDMSESIESSPEVELGAQLKGGLAKRKI